MAVDDEGGVSKRGSMPWPKNSNDLKSFKKYTINNVVIMGRLTWIDSSMPSPLQNRINVLITKQDKAKYPGADEYISGDLISKIKLINTKYEKQDLFIIGGPKIIDQLFELIEEFYLTRIYGEFDCDKTLDLKKIEDAMTLKEKIINDKTCHFEIWKR
jgi:dihydrofolate reductase